MNHYNEIKDIIFFTHPVLGDLTIDDFLTNIELFLKDVELFESVVANILYKHSKNKETVDEIMNISSSSIIKSYIDIIRGIS